jgi:trk system potassium uptake protein TrkH
MNLFESVCHAFGTVATGGFSPKNTSIGGYSSYIQYVIMVFMLLSGMNFIIHYYLLKREFKKVKENEEIKFYLLSVLFIGAVITSVLYSSRGTHFEESFRESFFQVISIVTCTGYATADYLQWPLWGWLIVFFAMFLGGSTGSTAGGIKMARHLMLFKNIGRFFRESVHPKAIFPIKLNGKAISEQTNSSILAYPAVYMLVFVLGSFVLLFTGLDGKTAASSAATAMAGIGPGIGTVGPAANFAHLSVLAKLTMAVLMILGRLEIYTVLILFTRKFWTE